MNSDKMRRAAALRLGVALLNDYRGLVEATNQDEIQTASITLGVTFNDNIEFIINVLKHYGGLEVKFEPLTKPKSGVVNAVVPKTPTIFAAGRDVDMPKGKLS